MRSGLLLFLPLLLCRDWLGILHLQLAPFDPTKKKKKKKVVIQENADESVDSLAEKTESLSGNF